VFEYKSTHHQLMTWPQVRFERGAIEVLQRVDQWNVMGDCKTEPAYRPIPVSQHLLDVLRDWKELCPPSEHNLVLRLPAAC
jgi:hypothetical protein